MPMAPWLLTSLPGHITMAGYRPGWERWPGRAPLAVPGSGGRRAGRWQRRRPAKAAADGQGAGGRKRQERPGQAGRRSSPQLLSSPRCVQRKGEITRRAKRFANETRFGTGTAMRWFCKIV